MNKHFTKFFWWCFFRNKQVPSNRCWRGSSEYFRGSDRSGSAGPVSRSSPKALAAAGKPLHQSRLLPGYQSALFCRLGVAFTVFATFGVGDFTEAVSSEPSERHIGIVSASLGAKLFQQVGKRFVDLKAVVKQARVASFVLRQHIQQQQRLMRRAYVTLTPHRDVPIAVIREIS
jgi:hypothetical protein